MAKREFDMNMAFERFTTLIVVFSEENLKNICFQASSKEIKENE